MSGQFRFVSDLNGFRGDAKLYEVEAFSFGDGETTKWIVASAVIVPLSGPETYLFPSDENGKILNWGELEGSQRGVVSHEEAMRGWANAMLAEREKVKP